MGWMGSAGLEEHEGAVVISIFRGVLFLQRCAVLGALHDLYLFILAGAVAGRVDALRVVPVGIGVHAHAVGLALIVLSDVLLAGGEVDLLRMFNVFRTVDGAIIVCPALTREVRTNHEMHFQNGILTNLGNGIGLIVVYDL